jgi:hypothetical protein
MPEETKPEPSSPVVAVDQNEESIKEGPPRELATRAAKEVTVAQTRRRTREAAGRARARPMGAPIAGPPLEIAKRGEKQSGGLTPVRTSGASASPPAEQSAEKEKAIAPKIISATPHSADAIAKLPAAVREITTDEAVGSPEALPEESVQASTERPAPWEIERKLQLEPGLQSTTEHAFARWRNALWEAVHGGWSEAGWEFASGVFHVLTQAATWRRVGKAVLNFLARFVPGHEGPILRRHREIKELFSFLHEEPKKPGTWSNCPK